MILSRWSLGDVTKAVYCTVPNGTKDKARMSSILLFFPREPAEGQSIKGMSRGGGMAGVVGTE